MLSYEIGLGLILYSTVRLWYEVLFFVFTRDGKGFCFSISVIFCRSEELPSAKFLLQNKGQRNFLIELGKKPVKPQPGF